MMVLKLGDGKSLPDLEKAGTSPAGYTTYMGDGV